MLQWDACCGSQVEAVHTWTSCIPVCLAYLVSTHQLCPVPCCAVPCCVVQTTSAALGYLLLFIDQVGLIMGGPVLHESMYQGSTSSIWQPPGFWTRQPRSPSSVLPLNVLTTGQAAGAAAGQAAYSSTTNRCVLSAAGMHSWLVIHAGNVGVSACMCADWVGECMCASQQLSTKDCHIGG
jgi:hypothetical protein